VIFESALSLGIMPETDKVDLRPDFEIKFVEYDCSADLSGYIPFKLFQVSMIWPI
jgi:hypothetical protein